jgi:FkbM family methyltransferase
MRFRDFFKVLARSKSLGFAIQTVRQVPSKSLARLRWRGHDVFYRPGTSDHLAIYQVLLRRGRKAEYYVPRELRPTVILDIGSNIGASILYFHEQFPSARILGFEPHPETFRILQSNVSGIPSVSVFNYGLGPADARISVPFEGIDFSAFTAKMGSGPPPVASATTNCEIRHAGSALRNLGISTVDLIKIDCEGAEYEILRTLPEEMLRQCKWIVGEIHDSSGFDLLALLAPHFDLDLKKRMFVPFFRFHACNLGNIPQLRGTFDRNALQI